MEADERYAVTGHSECPERIFILSTQKRLIADVAGTVDDAILIAMAPRVLVIVREFLQRLDENVPSDFFSPLDYAGKNPDDPLSMTIIEAHAIIAMVEKKS